MYHAAMYYVPKPIMDYVPIHPLASYNLVIIQYVIIYHPTDHMFIYQVLYTTYPSIPYTIYLYKYTTCPCNYQTLLEYTTMYAYAKVFSMSVP